MCSRCTGRQWRVGVRSCGNCVCVLFILAMCMQDVGASRLLLMFVHRKFVRNACAARLVYMCCFHAHMSGVCKRLTCGLVDRERFEDMLDEMSRGLPRDGIITSALLSFQICAFVFLSLFFVLFEYVHLYTCACVYKLS